MPAQITKISKLGTKQLSGGNGFLGHKGFELQNSFYQPLRNKPTIIHNRSYSGHSLDQMQNRGFTPSIIEGTIQNSAGMPNKVFGGMQFYDSVNNVSVITENGEVITVIYGKLN